MWWRYHAADGAGTASYRRVGHGRRKELQHRQRRQGAHRSPQASSGRDRARPPAQPRSPAADSNVASGTGATASARDEQLRRGRLQPRRRAARSRGPRRSLRVGGRAASIFSSTADNQFSVRSAGGARFVSATDATGTDRLGRARPGGGSWSSLSDEASKRASRRFPRARCCASSPRLQSRPGTIALRTSRSATSARWRRTSTARSTMARTAVGSPPSMPTASRLPRSRASTERSSASSRRSRRSKGGISMKTAPKRSPVSPCSRSAPSRCSRLRPPRSPR